MSGGGEKARYRLALGYYDEQGTTKGTGMNRLSTQMKITYNFSDRLRVHTDFSFTNTKKDANVLSSARSMAMKKMPNLSPYWIDDATGQPTDRYFTQQSDFQGASFSKDNFISFPEEIKNGKVLTVYGTEVNVNPDEVTDRRMCANGVLYGMDHMDAPAIFSSVVGPAFKDTTYMDYLYALDGSELVLSLASNKSKFVTLMPKNAQFAATDPAMRLYTTTTGKELQQYSSEAGDFVALGSGAMRDIVNIHTATNVASLPSSGTAVIETNTAYNYWFIDNGRITTNALFNEQLEPTYDGDPFVAFHPIQNNGKNWDNGSSYSYDAEAIFQPASGDGLARRLAVCNDKNFSYYMFAQLLQKAGLTEGNALSNSILPTDDTRFICFVPTNDAIIANLTDIPGCSKLSVKDGTLDGSVTGTNKNQLAAYLRSYFITSTMNSFTSYPYLGSSCKGEFYTTGTEKMQIEDNGAATSMELTTWTAV